MAARADFRRAVDLFGDWRWRLSNLYWITDKEGRKSRFTMNWAQEALFREMHYLNVILKARQLGFCLDPETRVLKADLRWVRIADLAPGDEVVSVDEHAPGGKEQHRRMRTAVVQGVVEVRRPAYRISFCDGRSVVCTDRHPWLSKKVGSGCSWRSIKGDGKNRLTVGTKIRWVTRPWDSGDMEDGWFGGMLDGEGSFAKRNVAAGINVSQRAGPVWDRLLGYLASRGYSFRIEDDAATRDGKFGSTPVPKLVVGRMNELFRLIGQTRPTRFIGNRFWEGRELPGKRNGGVGWSTITAIDEVGEQTLVDLQTSTGTYIAEGFVSHNTTFVQVFMLDAVVFNTNIRAGTIAHTRDDAQTIFRDKVRFPYDNLPEGIRNAVPVVTANASEMLLGNNSSIRVGTSLRSGTLQYLHISEYGKMCARFPDKAREVRTGALNTVQSGQIAFIESTAEGQDGHFYELCQQAASAMRKGTPLTPLDFKFHFFPWWKHPDYAIDADVVIEAPMAEYFDKLEHESGVTLTREQKAWYAKKAEQQGSDMKREFPSTPEEAFEASVEGAYYSDQIAKAESDGRIGDFPAHDGVAVDTFWDIGVGDNNAIWFAQRTPKRRRFIAYYQNSGEGMPHYLTTLHEMQQRHGWTYGDHWLPHDAKVKEWGSGRTRVEQMADGIEIDGKRFRVRPRLVPMHKIDDGINAARAIFSTCEFDEGPCAEGLKALRSYRKEWDDERGVWKDTPRHDWASHGADAFRYFAMADREVAPKADSGPPDLTKLPTFDDVIRQQQKRNDRSRSSRI